jgi:hypothetical protein
MKKANINEFILFGGSLLFLVSFSAEANWGVNLGFSYNSGRNHPSYGVPYGYGAAGASIGAIGGACFPQPPVSCQAIGGICGPGPAPGGGGGPIFAPPVASFPPPMAAPMPPPAPVLPPHLALPNAGWGPGFASFPGPVMPGAGGWGANCVPCGLGMQPPMIGPVPGGPVVGGGFLNSGLASGYGMGMGLNFGASYAEHEWQKNDTASIIMATGIGMGMQATNVFPIAVPRHQPTFIAPGFYGDGSRNSALVPRPTH